MLVLQVLTALSLAITAKSIPLYPDTGVDSLFYNQPDLGQADLESFNVGQPSFYPSESSNLVALNSDLTSEFQSIPLNPDTQNALSFNQVDLGSTIVGQPGSGLSESSSLYALNSDLTSEPQPILGTVLEGSNAVSGQGFTDFSQGLSQGFPDLSQGLLAGTGPDLNLLALAGQLSCPRAGSSIFCCPDQSDEDCIPSKSYLLY